MHTAKVFTYSKATALIIRNYNILKLVTILKNKLIFKIIGAYFRAFAFDALTKLARFALVHFSTFRSGLSEIIL